MPDNNKYTVLRATRRIWAVGAIHGEADRLRRLHQLIGPELTIGDRLVYLGNYLGYGSKIRETVDELLRFRRLFLTIPPYMDADDVVLLRGCQEEMWQKLLQLQFAVRPEEILEWMFARGVQATLDAYDGDVGDGFSAARDGTMALTHWTTGLRATVRRCPGHETLMSALRRAAFTAEDSVLLVNTGVDTSRPVMAQTDTFWWAGRSFSTVEDGYQDFRRVVRGYDPEHGGFKETARTLTVDGGCGFGGSLVAVCLAPDGEVLRHFEA